MSLYNMINGVNPATFVVLPMLNKHPDLYPRFRDCFIGEMTNSQTETDQFGIPRKQLSQDNVISVYTRVGGGNRDDYEDEIETLRSVPEYLKDYDDDFDSTFATFVFSVPAQWEEDFIKIREGRFTEVSEEYIQQTEKVYPKIAEQLRVIFRPVNINDN